MQNRERGAAHINIYFFLVLLVLFIGTLWFGYIQLSEVEGAREAAKKADAAKLAAERDLQHYKHYVEEISAVIGVTGEWKGKEGYVWDQRFDKVTPKPLSATVPADVKAQLENLAKTLSIGATQATPIPGFLGAISALYTEQVAAIAKAESDVKAAQAQVSTLSNSFRTTDAAHTTKFNTLQGDYTRNMNDLRTANQQKDQRLAAAQADVRTANEEKAKLQEDHALVVKAFKKEKQKLDGQMEAWRALNAMRQPPQVADASVISASMIANRGWVDIGRKDMLLRGTKFRITNPNGTKVKGYGEVISTQQDRSELRLYDVVDPIGDPITRGDQIYNELYSPNMKRNIAMIGRFSYPYTQPTIKKLLERLGNKVHDKVHVGVDMVIVGLQDPTEAGDALKPIEETPGYKEAQALHCEIITVQKIRDLLQLDDQ